MESVRRTKQELMERIGLVQAHIDESTAQVRKEKRERGRDEEERVGGNSMCVFE
jgi:hypothetical protein